MEPSVQIATPKTKRAFITGGAGQDGWYLAGALRAKGYLIHVQSRHRSADAPADDVIWHVGDPIDRAFMERTIASLQPDVIFNLAAISRPTLSWSEPTTTALLNALMPQHLCDLIHQVSSGSRLFQASSSDVFGNVPLGSQQNEETPFSPSSPYGIAKAYAHRIVGAYRAQYGLHLSSGILFNHESPRRPLSFVSQKIAHAAAAASLGLQRTTELDELGRPILQDGKVVLGDLNIRRDFGYAGDYVEAMILMVESDQPDDYVIGSGSNHSIAEFCEAAFRVAGRDWHDHVVSDPNLVRHMDNRSTCADPRKIQDRLGWKSKVSFDGLVETMVRARIKAIEASLD